jgi:molybdopterin/thiamine biosynthesis adenylyltransferase
MMMHKHFQHASAFSRNLGWLTTEELVHLRGADTAIAGLGGVGGSHLLTLARLGIGRFRIADFDRFELANFNRQVGATLSHLGRPKVDVLAEMALDINPELVLTRFGGGVNGDNLEAFLGGADVYVDGLDFFALPIRRQVFAACAEMGIPAITAAPIGWGAALLVFVPGGTGFEDYFQLEGQPEDEQLRRFLVGLSPELMQMGALMDPSRVDLERRTGPSTPVGCELCAALAATTAVKLLLGRGDVRTAPASLHIDAFSGECRTIERPGGMQHPAMQAALTELRDGAE